MAEECKREKLQLEKEDRISALPDSLIQYILALLPSTKEAIRTGVLSKRWHNQWCQVPVLIFYDSGMSHENFSKFIDDTLHLHDCSKIQKLHIQSYNYMPCADPQFDSKLCFAIRKNVEELILQSESPLRPLMFPDFFFYHASLVKLHIFNSELMRNESVRWEQLRELKIECSTLSEFLIPNILIGSPLLERLELIDSDGFSERIFSSESLKKLVLEFHDLDFSEMEISCPKLEELKLMGSYFGRTSIKFNDLSSLIFATLDFKFYVDVHDYENEDDGSFVEILRQLQHVKELTLGSYFIDTLQWLEHMDVLDSPLLNNKPLTLEDIEGLGYPLLNNKSLTLDCPDFGEHADGIAYALRIFPKLEKLVIKDPVYTSVGLSTDYWDSKAKTLKSSLSHLKTVHIVVFGKRSKHEIPHDFVDFLSKNAPVMEKLVVLKDR